MSYDTALSVAIVGGDFKVFLTLLEAGANPNILDDQGYTILVDAVFSHNIEMVQTLLKHSSIHDESGNFSLYLAARWVIFIS